MNGLKASMNNNKTKHSRTRYNLKVEHIFERANSKVNLVTMLSGKTFYTDEKTSLLHAAEREGISLPYSCRNGRCSSCKCRISGPTIINFDELGLSDVEKKNGWKLACARSAIGDISLDIADLGNVNLPKPKIFPTKIDKLEYLTPDILKVSLRLPPSTKFEFVEGQYINLTCPNGISRSYSLARRCDGQNLELHIQRIMNGQMSDYLFEEAKIGDLLRINGPYGTFTLRETSNINVIFLATGTGIAPVKAMLEHIELMPQELIPNSVKIYWGMRYEQDLYWKPSQKLTWLHFIPVLSRATDNWTGSRGYVQDAMMQDIETMANLKIYSCGSNLMIQAAKSKVTNFGLPEEHFCSDAFVASN
jgi:CDP-4-dehydro-6-deoxyglucose reductase, E3